MIHTCCAVNIYLQLTKAFNSGRLRAIISSGQAVVLHRLAIMSKDGDWILREDDEALGHVLDALGAHNARYRFGAPLDKRWMAGGWSAHLEFHHENIRVRTDFVTRPPRLNAQAIERLWTSHLEREIPFLDARNLAEVKKTNREKDYVVIGELARLMPDPLDRLLYSRSARDLKRLAADYPEERQAAMEKRPLLKKVHRRREELEAALDAERRALIRANEQRLAVYTRAAEGWAVAWPDVAREIAGRSLQEAHPIVIERAEGILPYEPATHEG